MSRSKSYVLFGLVSIPNSIRGDELLVMMTLLFFRMCATRPPINDLAALDTAVSGFDRIDLLSAVARIRLLPENAERHRSA